MATDGAQSSELKVTLAGVLGGTVSAVALALSGYPVVAAILAGAGIVLAAIYALCRSWVKAEREGKIDILTPAQEAKLEKYGVNIVKTLLDMIEAAKAKETPAEPTEND